MVEGIKPTVSMLREVKLLRNLTDSELMELANTGEAQQYEAHTNIVIEGELSWGVYLIIRGTVGIYKNNKLTGDVFDVGQLQSGAFFGEMSLIDDNPRSATVRAAVDCILFHISKESFMDYLNRSVDRKTRFYETCVQDLVGRLRELDENFVISQYQLWKAAIKKESA